VFGSGDVIYQTVSTARTRATLSVQLDLSPSEPEGPVADGLAAGGRPA
jgi:hypothetical protein